MDFLKGGLHRLGILKGIESIADHEDIAINEEMYSLIDQWKALYSGYYEPWHNLEYKTIDGTKTRRMDTLNMAKTASQEMASLDRKSTRLNSSHVAISYAVFCLKKK